MNRMAKTLGRAAAALLLLASVLSFVPSADAEVRWWTHPKIAAGLELSQAQVEAIDQLSFSWEKQKIDLEADVARARLELRRALDTEPLEDGRIEAANNRLADAQCALLRAKQDHRLEIAKQLTLEQRRQLQRWLAKFKRKWTRGRSEKLGGGDQPRSAKPPAP